MRKLRKNEKAIVFELLMAGAMTIVILFALMNIGTFINGTIGDSLADSTDDTDIENTLINVSTGYSTNIDIMVISAIITVITIPLAAVVAVRRLM